MTSFAHDSPDLAAMYDRVSDIQLDGGKRLVERLGVKEGQHVLDVGCGTGRLAQWIAERVGPTGVVAGIDPLDERIRIARVRGGAVRFEVGQAEDLGAFADSSFDAVCMSSVFHWVDDKRKALAEVRRVLRPGGRLGMTTIPQELVRAGTIGRAFATLLARPPYLGRVELAALTFGRNAPTSSGLVSLLVENELELVEMFIVRRTNSHTSGEAFVDFLDASAFGNLLQAIPEDLRAPMRADLIAELGLGSITVRGWGLLLVAERV